MANDFFLRPNLFAAPLPSSSCTDDGTDADAPRGGGADSRKKAASSAVWSDFLATGSRGSNLFIGILDVAVPVAVPAAADATDGTATD
ncbi:hypothetical protein E4U41_004642, partial [Claviceps citrina]